MTYPTDSPSNFLSSFHTTVLNRPVLLSTLSQLSSDFIIALLTDLHRIEHRYVDKYGYLILCCIVKLDELNRNNVNVLESNLTQDIATGDLTNPNIDIDNNINNDNNNIMNNNFIKNNPFNLLNLPNISQFKPYVLTHLPLSTLSSLNFTNFIILDIPNCTLSSLKPYESILSQICTDKMVQVLFTLGEMKCVKRRNREVIYRVVKRFINV